MRNLTMEKIAITLLLTAFILLPYPVASSPTLINFQGVLKDAADQPVTNTIPITFEIFGHETDGSTDTGVWQETHPGVVVIDGVYNVLLGSVNTDTLVPGLFVSNTLWLEVTVDGEIMSPRQRITSVAYALNADSVDGLDSTSFLSSIGGTMTGDLIVDGHVTIANGTEDEGKVMMSDTFGVARWELPTINSLSDGMHTDGRSLFLGTNAGKNDDGGINWNIGIGYRVLEENISGERNTALGYTALQRNITGGNSNTAIGSGALSYNTTGSSNTAVGTSALVSNTTGRHNNATGSAALFQNETGEFNTANGSAALYNNFDGDSNTAIGYHSLYSHTTGWGNVAIGKNSDFHNGAGIKNTIIGTSAGSTSPLNSQSGNVFIGYAAGANETGSNKLYIENSNSATPLIYGDFVFGSRRVRIHGDFETTGQIKIEGGTPGAGKVLISDANGLATWQSSVDSAVHADTATSTVTATSAVHADTATSAGNADTLDSLDSTSFAASIHNHDTRYYSQAYVDGLEARLLALEELLSNFTKTGDEIIITGANLHIRSGSGSTDGGVNGNGNLVVGYNETRDDGSDDRTGSHNIIVGNEQNFSSYGGFAAGRFNNITGPYSSVSGGIYNTAEGYSSSVKGGILNTATGYSSSVSGGSNNTTTGSYSSVSGGRYNLAIGDYSSVTGGGGATKASRNTATGHYSSVSGGTNNTAEGSNSSVSGGGSNTATADFSNVSGGILNKATGYSSSVSGGSNNTTTGLSASISGGRFNLASGNYSSVTGGGGANVASSNEAHGHYAVVLGGQSNLAGDPVKANHDIGQLSTVAGGFKNIASGLAASVSGGRENEASGAEASVSGGVYNDATETYSSANGGAYNEASGHGSAVSGGYENTASASYSTVP